MQQFIQQIRQYHDRLLENPALSSTDQENLQKQLNGLRLAEAVLLKKEWQDHNRADGKSPGPLHIGIIGPTQAGKSTLVNLMLQHEAAGISPLAGYTVHAQGFASGDLSGMDTAIETLFHDYHAVDKGSLDAKKYKQYLLETGMPALWPGDLPTVLWDSPDFDSIESRGYRSAVLRVIAISDALILMVSKDKYADQAVWDMLKLIQPLNKPLLVVINKLSAQDAPAVQASFNQRFQTEIGANIPPLLTLRYQRDLTSTASELSVEYREQLLQLLEDEIDTHDTSHQDRGLARWLDQHWEDWLQPANEELSSEAAWQQSVEQAVQSGLERYQEQYLDHPGKYDTFNRTLAELLPLLEIPGLAKHLVATRQIVTWPMRKLLGIGRSVINRPDESSLPTELEDEVLRQCLQHVIMQLNNQAMNQQQTNSRASKALWWQNISAQLLLERQATEGSFLQAVDDYQAKFAPEIEASARRLYDRLQTQPTLLNSLRAARFTTDAAAVVLAVKSGGLAAIDLVMAPAMLSVTTLLTESALGKYLDNERDALKKKQLEHVESTLFDSVLESNLLGLPARVPGGSGILSSGITRSRIQSAREQLNQFVKDTNV